MKLVTYQSNGSAAQLGALVGDQVINLAQASGGKLPSDMRSFLELGDAGLQAARDAVDGNAAGATVALADVKLLAPIPNPSKVVAIGLNYMDHILETNSNDKVPRLPTFTNIFRITFLQRITSRNNGSEHVITNTTDLTCCGRN